MTRKLFTIDEYVRWSDVDAAGIIFYGAYVRFFEIAEIIFRVEITEYIRAQYIPAVLTAAEIKTGAQVSRISPVLVEILVKRRGVDADALQHAGRHGRIG